MSESAPALADGSEGERVLVELSSEQIDRVVRDARGAGNMSVLLSLLPDARNLTEVLAGLREDAHLSRSLLLGLLLLAAFPADGSYLSNAQVAHLLDIHTSTAHRYISTLVAAGLLERDPTTRRYRLAYAP